MDDRAAPAVLIVKDAPFTQELYRVRWHERGHNAGTAGDGKQALQKIRSSRPDVVLLDMILPKVTGFDILARMESGPRSATIPGQAASWCAARARRERGNAAKRWDRPTTLVAPSWHCFDLRISARM